MNHEDDKGRIEELARFGREAGTSRRDFMNRAAILGVAAATASSLWAKQARAQQMGGTLRAAIDGGDSTNTLDPQLAIGTSHITLSAFSVYDRLVTFDNQGNAVPQLAESWDVSDDGKTWRFALRKGVTFQNGQEMTAEDVVASMAYAAGPDSTWAEGQGWYASFAEVKADGHGIVIVQNEADGDLPAQLAQMGWLTAPAGTQGDGWNQPGNGTGPYIIEDFVPGVRFIGRRNPNYYRDDEAFFDSIELEAVGDATARASALQSGDVDFITRPDPKTAGLLGQMPGMSLIQAEGSLHFTMPMRADLDPYTDNNIRLAMKHVINREEFVEKILGGFGYVGNDVPIGRRQQFFNNTMEQHSYDPDKARYYLKQAGLDSIAVTLSASDGAFVGSVDAAALAAESAATAGVSIDIERVPADGYWSDTWLVAPWCYSYWSGRPTVGMMLSSAFISTTDWNEGHWKNERFDELVAMARGETDQDLRQEMYFEAQQILHDDGSVVIPAFGTFLHAASERFGHNEFGGTFYCDNYGITRNAWSVS